MDLSGMDRSGGGAVTGPPSASKKPKNKRTQAIGVHRYGRLAFVRDIKIPGFILHP